MSLWILWSEFKMSTQGRHLLLILLSSWITFPVICKFIIIIFLHPLGHSEITKNGGGKHSKILLLLFPLSPVWKKRMSRAVCPLIFYAVSSWLWISLLSVPFISRCTTKGCLNVKMRTDELVSMEKDLHGRWCYLSFLCWCCRCRWHASLFAQLDTRFLLFTNIINQETFSLLALFLSCLSFQIM